MSAFNQNELKALITLLDDSDEEVFVHISDRLVTLGKDVIPALEQHWSDSMDILLQRRIENVIHKIQLDALTDGFREWRRFYSDDLFRGLMLVARYQYPDMDEKKVYAMLDQLKEAAVVETQMHHAPLEKTKALNRVFFEIFGFRGNTANFHSPQNSFVNIVLETKKGNPLMLSAMYSIVARHAGMPVFGVNLPEHFILAYQLKNSVRFYEYTFPEADILFYINPFSRGTIFYKDDIDKFLRKLELHPSRIYYTPCTNIEIIIRSLRNLSFAYQRAGDTGKRTEVENLLESITS